MAELFYEDLFNQLESVFRSALSRPTRDAWSLGLAHLDRRALKISVSSICRSEEKMPSLARIIQACRGLTHTTGAPRFTPTRDVNKIACLWDPDKKELLYRAPDCKEGRQFLAELGRVAGKSPDQMARVFEKWCAKESAF
jgi:hypothetical protein